MTREPWLTKNRLETLVDGIFAIAMTLLVLNLKVPTMSDQQAMADLPAALGRLWPHFFAFGLSFVLLASFWMAHHRQFHFIEKVDSVFIWLNVLMLGLIVLVPFSTSLMGEYEASHIAVVFFELNLFGIGVCMYLYWWYAGINNRLLSDKATETTFRYGLKRSAVLPVVSLIAVGISLVSPQYSTIAFLLIPFTMATFLRR
ncbi:MAG: TMEM175 family protein [Actinomycetota bacterium]